MSKPRKTIDITAAVDTANAMLRHSTPEMERERSGIASFLEALLLDANAYKGFGYLASEYLPAAEQTDTKVLRDGYDPTRRRYYS